ncbi:MAG: hypothetical protein ACFFD4_40625, partial [Candidatus Odinarchaeota archaeon]
WLLLIFFFLSLIFWISAGYSNRQVLLLIRYINHASQEMKGMGRLHEDVQNLRNELDAGHWEEAKSVFSRIIERCNAALTKLHGSEELRKYGFIFIDFKKQKTSKKLQDIVQAIDSLQKTKTETQQPFDEKINRELTSGIVEKRKERDKKLENWEITSWEDFFWKNLPWWLKIDSIWKNWTKPVSSKVKNT